MSPLDKKPMNMPLRLSTKMKVMELTEVPPHHQQGKAILARGGMIKE
jgi:hypothetical protein